VARLDRRNDWALSVTERHVYVVVNGETIEGEITRFPLT
jgi:hypothetical protein